MSQYKLNVFTGKFDLVNNIPELDADPSSPSPEDAWVLRTGGAVSGGGVIQGWIGLGSTPILTVGSGDGAAYQFSYRTQAGTTVRTALT